VDLLFVRGDRVLTLCEMKCVERLAPAALRGSLERKMVALRTAFPGYGIQRVLLLGKHAAGQDKASRDFDRILTAEEVFL